MAILNLIKMLIPAVLLTRVGLLLLLVSMFLSPVGFCQDNVFYYGYNDSHAYYASDFIQTSDGGFLLIGDVASSMPLFENPYYGRYLVKTDSQGDTLWTQYHSQENYGSAHIMESGTNEILALGSIGENYICNNVFTTWPFVDHLFQQYSPSGELLASDIISVGCANTLNDIEPTQSGGLVGISDAIFNPEIIGAEHYYNIIHLDSAGNIEQIPFFGNKDEIIALDGNYILASNDKITKYNPLGALEWNVDVSLAPSPTDFVADGDHLVFACSAHDDYVNVVKVDTLGTEEWSHEFDMQCRDIMKHSSGDYFLTGEFGTDLMVLAISADGDSIWSKTYDLTLSGHGIKTIETDDGIAIFGYSGGFGQASQYVMILEPNEEITFTLSGCTNPNAENYNPEATIDDGSCFVLGDLDGDGLVTTIDLLILLGELGCEPFCDADLNGDGLVTILDLLIILGELTCC